VQRGAERERQAAENGDAAEGDRGAEGFAEERDRGDSGEHGDGERTVAARVAPSDGTAAYQRL
jgi:hypothetical protein